MKFIKRIFFLIGILEILLFPNLAYSKVGVGVNTGKIIVEDKLRPGIIYNLPPLTVINTGDEAAEYEVGVAYHDKQPELRPAKEWFAFSPKNFSLEPGKGQKIEIKLNLPIKAEPGNYFAYLEGYPVKKSESGQTTVGVAAGTKLYFTVVAANPVLGVYYRVISIWKINQPWSSRVATILTVIVIYWTLHKFFGFQISFKGTKKEEKNE